MTNISLSIELLDLLEQINQQIDIIILEANKMDISHISMRKPDGSWVMVELLHAKAQVLSSLVLLKEDI